MQLNTGNMTLLNMDVEIGTFPVAAKPILKRKYTAGGLVLGDKSFFHGINPQWTFKDENYFDKWFKLQEKHKKRLKDLRKKRRRFYRIKHKYDHNKIMCLVGPEWYQELSPIQKETVDDLQECIKKDLALHKTDFVRANISKLGLRPLPNHKQLWYSCKKSYGCPVNFLLELYQILKPDKNRYTINDRLILSSIVHLTLMDTLREMHVRMPSPPRCTPPTQEKPPKRKAKKYASPYLIPFTFKRSPPKHSGIYHPPNKQYPECQYFDYICSLKPKLHNILYNGDQDGRIDEFCPIPCELYEEHQKAEYYYNKLFQTNENAWFELLRPKTYETKVPKTKPGILPTFITGRKPKPLLRMELEVIILEDSDGKKKTRCTIDCKAIPPSGKIIKGPTVAKYVFLRDVTGLVKKLSIRKHCRCSYTILPKDKEALVPSPSTSTLSNLEVEEVVQGTYPCSRCGGPEGKKKIVPTKPVKVKSWIKRPKKKVKKKKVVEQVQLDFSVKIVDEVNEFLFNNGKKIEFAVKYKRVGGVKETHQVLRKNFFLDKYIQEIEQEKKEIQKMIDEDNFRFLQIQPGPGLFPVASFMLDEEEDPNAKCVCKKQEPVQKQSEDFCECAKKWVNYVMIDNAQVFKNFQQENIKNNCNECSNRQPTKNKNKTSNTEVLSSTSKLCKASLLKPIKCIEYQNTCSISNHCHRRTQQLLNKLKCPCPKCVSMRDRKTATFIYGESKATSHGILPVIRGEVGGKECDCLPKFEEKIKTLENYKKRIKAKIDLKSQSKKFVIGGVVNFKSGPIYNIIGVVPTYDNKCSCKYKPDMKPTENLSPSKKKVSHNLVILGKQKQKNNEKNDTIVGSVVEPKCECHKIYKKFLAEHNECLATYEKYIKKMENHLNDYNEDMKLRYKNPPVTGQQLIEEEIKNLMRVKPSDVLIPEGKSTFLISGVEATELGKVFILGGAMLNRNKHEKCSVKVESYNFLDLKEKVSDREQEICQKTYLCNYMLFGKDCNTAFTQNQRKPKIISPSVSSEVVCRCISYDEEREKSVCILEQNNDNSTAPKAEPELKPKISIATNSKELKEKILKEPDYIVECMDPCICLKCGESITEISIDLGDENCRCYKFCGCSGQAICVPRCNDPLNIMTDLINQYKPTLLPQIIDEDEIAPTPSKKLLKAKSKNNILKELMKWGKEGQYMLNAGGGFKRFVILKKIPKSSKKQELILRKILLAMAEDGYPLAKLPDCHKIPYFWLWMELRKGSTWNQSDRYKNYLNCLQMWHHIMFCKRNVKLPKLPFHCKCYAQSVTWKEAPKFKKMIQEAKSNFYDEIRRGLVNYARENLATISPYQYPAPPSLLNYYYAYAPGKPENAVVEQVWQNFEVKNPYKRKSCFCK